MQKKAPRGRFIRLGNIRDLGVLDIKQFILNKEKIEKQIELSESCGCHIEAISLRLQKIDFWLRFFVNRKTQENLPPTKQFGDVLKKARPLLTGGLNSELEEFNRDRITAIHHFILGKGDYSEVIKTSQKFRNLPKKVLDFVMKEAKAAGPFFASLPEATKV